MPSRKTWVERTFKLNMWFGLSLGSWIKLLSTNRFAIESKQTVAALITTVATTLNTIAGRLEKTFYSNEIDKTKLIAPPLFIVGYWRTGTTYLHNLIGQDERFTFPTTYTCMFPHHFLLTEHLGKRLLSMLLPETRPMDNMPLSWDLPQEDEVALALLGKLSPYMDFAFPNTQETNHKYLDFNDATPAERELFKKLITYFVKKHTFRSRKRVVLKSPAHSYRIKLLLEAFPDAQFIHIYRDPITVFLSAVHMFTIIRKQVGWTKPNNSNLEQRIIEDMLLCYQHIREDQALLAQDQFHEIRFENLERNPLLELEKTYKKLNLGGFESVKPKLEAYLASISNYQKNRYIISHAKRQQLAQRLHPIIKAYGYKI